MQRGLKETSSKSRPSMIHGVQWDLDRSAHNLRRLRDEHKGKVCRSACSLPTFKAKMAVGASSFRSDRIHSVCLARRFLPSLPRHTDWEAQARSVAQPSRGSSRLGLDSYSNKMIVQLNWDMGFRKNHPLICRFDCSCSGGSVEVQLRLHRGSATRGLIGGGWTRREV